LNEDRKVNKKTVAVRFGSTFSKWEYAAALLLAVCTPLIFIREAPRTLIACLTLFPAILLMRQLFSTESHKLDALLPKTAKLLLLYTILFCIGLL